MSRKPILTFVSCLTWTPPGGVAPLPGAGESLWSWGAPGGSEGTFCLGSGGGGGGGGGPDAGVAWGWGLSLGSWARG